MKKLISAGLLLAACLYPIFAFAVNTVENISNEELVELIESGVVLVDIRTEPEWKETGIVDGSHTITLFDEAGRPKQDFLPKLEKIAGPDTPVIVICRTGNRTQVASQALTQQIGYKKIYNVTRGITDWISKGHPVVSYNP